jgi:LacI family transcriptional regulator
MPRNTTTRITIQEVATRSGVSPMTVSRVVNGSPRVRPETRRRVEAVVKELGYVPNRLARGLTRRKTGTLGLIVTDVANPFFTLIVRGCEDVAWRAGHHVILCNTQGDLERERGYVEDMLAFQVEGVLIAPVDDSSRSTVRLLARNSVPFVLIDRSISGLQADTVQGDSVAGARQLVEHLIALGHRRIGLVIEPSGISTARDRLAGYREAHIAAGIPIAPELIVESMAINPQRGHDATMQLLSLEDRPTAVFAVNNIVAVGVVEAAREHGLKVPDDLALVCFDDVEHASRLYPFLTVMKQPAETFGTLATQLLLDRIAGRGDEQHRNVVLPADFLLRESCGAKLRGQVPTPAAQTR